jgi:hypothetical protein
MTSIGRKPTNRTDAFIGIRSVSLNHGAYMEVPGQSFPLPSEARWWFVLHRVYQLGTYVNPVYTLIWVGFALPFRARPLLHTTRRCVAYNLRRASGRGRLTSTTMPNQAVGALRVRRSWVHAVVKTFQDKEPGREGSKEISRTGAEENWGWCGRGSEGRKPWMATP